MISAADFTDQPGGASVLLISLCSNYALRLVKLTVVIVGRCQQFYAACNDTQTTSRSPDAAHTAILGATTLAEMIE